MVLALLSFSKYSHDSENAKDHLNNARISN
jgi:hypothetical protein